MTNETNRLSFRFWFEKPKKMGTWEQAKKECNRLSLLETDGVIPMQSTGRCDSEGVEVFEDDIVEGDAWHSTTDANGDTCTILSDKYKYKKRAVVKWYDDTPFVGFRLQAYEIVIGNIHENPELLEANNE